MKEKDVKHAVLKQLERAHSQHQFDHIELIKDLVFTSEPFTAKNGLLTNTLKMRKLEIRARFKKEIEQCFKLFAGKIMRHEQE